MNIGTNWTTIFSAPDIRGQASRRHLHYHPATVQADPDNTGAVWIRPIGQAGYMVVPPGGAMRYDLKTIPDGIEAKAASGTEDVNVSIGELAYANDNVGTIDSIASVVDVTPYHADGTEGALISGVKWVDGKGGIDKATNVFSQLSYEHHEIHAGSHFNYCDYALNQANGATIEFVMTTPDSGKWSHLTFAFSASEGATLELFEGASGIAGGTTITPRNNNRNSATASTLGLVKDPASITSDGTRAAGFLAGGGRVAGFAEREKENVLKQNTIYLARITSRAVSNDIAWCAEWYEHTDKN